MNSKTASRRFVKPGRLNPAGYPSDWKLIFQVVVISRLCLSKVPDMVPRLSLLPIETLRV